MKDRKYQYKKSEQYTSNWSPSSLIVLQHYGHILSVKKDELKNLSIVSEDLNTIMCSMNIYNNASEFQVNSWD